LIGQKRAKLLNNVDIACDLNLETAKKVSGLFFNCVTINNVDDVVESDVDVVFVSVANSSLSPIAEKLALKGKHVLLEKPGGITATELQKLKDISLSTNSLIRIGYNHRYHPACLKALELIKEPDFGNIMFVRGRYGHGGRIGYEKEWRANPAISGGGELIDQGTHLIDLSIGFLGKLHLDYAATPNYFWDMAVEDNVFMSLKNEGGRIAFLQASCTEWKNMFSLEIYGKTGKLEISGLGRSYGVETLTFYKMLPEMGPPTSETWSYPEPDDSWTLEMGEFIHDIQTGTSKSDNLESSLEVLRVIGEIYSRTNR